MYSSIVFMVDNNNDEKNNDEIIIQPSSSSITKSIKMKQNKFKSSNHQSIEWSNKATIVTKLRSYFQLSSLSSSLSFSLKNSITKIIIINIIIIIIGCLSSLPVIVSAFNSPPVFDFKREIFVSENTPVGQMVTMVRTIDKEKDIITYGIDPAHWNDGSKYFRIDEKTGQIFVRESLAGQGGNFLNMYIKANDGHQTAKIEAVISVSKATDKGQIVHYPDIHAPPSHIFNTNNILINKTDTRPSFHPPTPKDIPLETLRPQRKQRPPITKLNTFSNRAKNETKNQQSITVKPDVDHYEQIPTEDKPLKQSSLLADILWPIGPYILISIFVPTLCLIFWCWIHKRSMPSRNAIKTFSHKIINNNKSESIETTTSSFTGDFDVSLFKTRFHETSADSGLNISRISNQWEFPRHHLRFMHILGQGCFGQVWKCETFNGNQPAATQTQIVAVKTLKENVGDKEKRDLLDELEVMKILDPHPNVVTLIGCCTERDPVYLIMEYVPYGKLQKYLADSREDIAYGSKQPHEKLESHDLISFAYQIAKGMEYLSSKGIIHRDLAARNILVGHNKICKIADFGLAKYNQEIYERKSEGRLPIRWMAIESLKDFIFTTKSDVWSFGILMWEIVTLGCTPYPGWTASEVIKKVSEGYRLEKPEHCKREMYNIMYYCWDRNPHHRPSFSELVCLLDNLFGSDDEYIELDRFPDHCYYNLLKPPGCNGGNSSEKL
ncbi:tyrosine kinase receptor Cad96Ca-like [Dermatophagoides pteronyssinus]|uniref:tyrosine kinase receptor Cad96Ca-like n=1 Tax=Dermatophagoides pteronyssinus TaxID=6956 RepID=UPI003F660C60